MQKKVAFIIAVAGMGVASSAVGDPYTPPPRGWSSGFSHGTGYSQVNNNDGAQFAIYCGVGLEPMTASIFFTVKSDRNVEKKLHLGAVFEIDGEPIDYLFDRSKSYGNGENQYSYDIYNVPTNVELNQIIHKLRRGNTLTVYVPEERIKQSFTLKGAAKNLEECNAYL